MSVKIDEKNGGKVLEVKLNGKLTKEDYKHFVPEVERLVKMHGKIRVTVYMHDFHGWTIGGLWEDIKFDLKHGGDIELLALIGETKWEHGMAAVCKPFTKAKIRYFDQSAAKNAYDWIEAA